ncbi:MAG: IclR family transcriptional regulator [Polaromonas sp.]|nr:IclR family transcriptional regulator [Polaromonas sp.]
MKTDNSSSPAAGAPADKSAADNGTVNRVLRILSCFAEREHWGLNDLSRALNLPRASTHRLLNLCRPLNFVTQDEDGHYRPGLELYRLAGKLAIDMPINKIAAPILEAVRDKTDETTILTLLVRNDLKMFFSMTASPAHPMRYTIKTNQLEPLAWGATGRSLLAFLSKDEIEEVIRRHEPSPLDARPLDVAELRRSLKKIREDGYAVTASQRTPDAVGVAVPFFDANGDVRGNVTLTIPDFRFKPARQKELLPVLRAAAAELARGLGWAR